MKNELFAIKVGLANLVKVVGFAYVIEKSQKCNVLSCWCFLRFCVSFKSFLTKNLGSVCPVKGLNKACQLTLLQALLDFLLWMSVDLCLSCLISNNYLLN